MDVIPAFMTASKCDEGYWLDDRGAYGKLDLDNGSYENDRSRWMPLFGMKKGNSMWHGQAMNSGRATALRARSQRGRGRPRSCASHTTRSKFAPPGHQPISPVGIPAR